MSRILGVSPFSPDVLFLTDPQLDLILAQVELDHPPPPTDPVQERYEAKVKELLQDSEAHA